MNDQKMLAKLPKGTFLTVLKIVDGDDPTLAAVYREDAGFEFHYGFPLHTNDCGATRVTKDFEARRKADAGINEDNERLPPDEYGRERFRQLEQIAGETALYQTWLGVRRGSIKLGEIKDVFDYFTDTGDLKPESAPEFDWKAIGMRVAKHLRQAGNEAADLALRIIVADAANAERPLAVRSHQLAIPELRR